jgi:LmbE family N-acetylglucosaminyl deacetylase
MLTLNFPQSTKAPFRMLCLGSHSDDIEIGCGGTILWLLSQIKKVDVVWVVFGASNEREEEARNSATQFLKGSQRKEVIVKNFRDGFFPFEGAQIKDFFEELKGVSPDLVFTHHRADAHQDHRLIAELTWNTFRNHWILEYEIPKYDGDLGQPNLFAPLHQEIFEKKVRFIMDTFKSQRGKPWFDKETFLGLMRLRGMECVAQSGYAEAFYCRKAVLNVQTNVSASVAFDSQRT